MSDVRKDPAAAGSGRYAVVAIVLHWTIAALIVLQVVLAGRMEGPRTPESFAVTQLHKSVGITILLLTLVRIAWRLLHPPPPMPATLKPWERTLARLTHAGFYGVMLGMPLTGWIMVSTSRIVLPTLLYGAVPWPMIPGLPDLAPAAKQVWHDVAQASHHTIIKFAYVLLALHVAGALKHQLFSRDEPVLARMAPGAKAGRWWEPRLLVIALAFVGVAAFGLWVRPPAPAMSAPAAVVAGSTAEPVEAQTPAAPGPAVSPPAPTEPVAWQVAPGSSLAFTSAWSGQPIKGRFDRWTAQIVFGAQALDRSKVSVSIDLASVNTGDAQRDAALPAPDWFDVANHPKATFTAGRFTQQGEGRFIAHGTLELRGVRKPADLPFQLTIAGDQAEARGSLVIDRNTFGVGQGEWAATDQIPAKVTVAIHVKARAVQASR